MLVRNPTQSRTARTFAIATTPRVLTFALSLWPSWRFVEPLLHGFSLENLLRFGNVELVNVEPYVAGAIGHHENLVDIRNNTKYEAFVLQILELSSNINSDLEIFEADVI